MTHSVECTELKEEGSQMGTREEHRQREEKKTTHSLTHTLQIIKGCQCLCACVCIYFDDICLSHSGTIYEVCAVAICIHTARI